MSGDGTGSDDVKISTEKTGSQCVSACITARESDKDINGVTIRSDNSPGCWCEKGLASVRYIFYRFTMSPLC